MEFYKEVQDKGLKSITINSELIRPEIFYVAEDGDVFYLIKGSYDTTDVSLVSASATYHTSSYRVSYIYSLSTSPLSLSVTYVSYDAGFRVNYSFNEVEEDKYELNYYYINKNMADESPKDKTRKETIVDPIINSTLPVLNKNFTKLIKDSVNLDYNFYTEFAADFYAGYKILNTYDNYASLFIILGAVGAATFLFATIYCFIYGTNKDSVPFYNIKYDQQCVGKGRTAKKDFFFSPFIPETIFELAGIALVFFGSLRLIYYFLIFIGALTISGAEFTEIPSSFFYFFMIGMFLLYFIDFDVFLDGKRLFRNIFMYLIMFFCVYAFEVVLINTLIETKMLIVEQIANRVTLPNNFGTIFCYFVMMLTLFYTPKRVNTKVKVICYRLLTIIPVTLIITNTLIFHYAISTWGWKLPTYVLYLFASEKTQISLLCVIYLLGLFVLKTFYEVKYGKEKAKILINGNKFTLYKNTLAAVTVLSIGLLEIGLQYNRSANKLGIGLYPYITLLSPFLLSINLIKEREVSLLI